MASAWMAPLLPLLPPPLLLSPVPDVISLPMGGETSSPSRSISGGVVGNGGSGFAPEGEPACEEGIEEPGARGPQSSVGGRGGSRLDSGGGGGGAGSKGAGGRGGEGTREGGTDGSDHEVPPTGSKQSSTLRSWPWSKSSFGPGPWRGEAVVLEAPVDTTVGVLEEFAVVGSVEEPPEDTHPRGAGARCRRMRRLPPLLGKVSTTAPTPFKRRAVAVVEAPFVRRPKAACSASEKRR
mmetsp:Transcript_26332/g.54299  ORF Transcript_26332/g.54299 Transcript_26332/m.54299 type:complete len:237 (+) Transcript_26332:1-711(+)